MAEVHEPQAVVLVDAGCAIYCLCVDLHDVLVRTVTFAIASQRLRTKPETGVFEISEMI